MSNRRSTSGNNNRLSSSRRESSAALLSSWGHQEQWQLLSEEHALPDAALPKGFSAIELPVQVDSIRSIISIDQHRCLVLERQGSSGNVVLLSDDGTDDDDEDEENDDIPEKPKPSFGSSYCGKMCSSKTTNTGIFNQRRIVVSAPGINHGLAIHNNYLYASSDSHVYRWPYDPVEAQVTGEVQTVIVNINAIDDSGSSASAGQHKTRSLIFDDQDQLLVSVGSIGNVDNDSFRARIRRFVIPNESSDEFPLDFVNGEVFADGLRNEVGLAWDRYGILWGVQTGPDRLDRADLGGTIINEDNPAELLHAFREEGLHYGYPYCWMEYHLEDEDAMGPGTMWTWPSFMVTVTDEECRNTDLYTPAELPMQGHSSPLGMTFYKYKQEAELATGCSGAFPQSMDGYAFIAFHGSWNRQIPTGYKVVYVPMDGNGYVDTKDAIDLLAHSGSGAKWPDGFRPVDVDFDECGRLLVSSDGTSGVGTKVVRIDYNDQARGSGRLHSDPSNRHRDLRATSSGSFLSHYGHSLMLSAFIFLIVARGIICRRQ